MSHKRTIRWGFVAVLAVGVCLAIASGAGARSARRVRKLVRALVFGSMVLMPWTKHVVRMAY